MQPDSFVLTSDSQAEFYRHQPIDFFLYDEEGDANLYILNDNVPGKVHNFILVNESEADLRIVGKKSVSPDGNNYHFELRFRPGTIDADYHGWITVGSGEWLMRSKRWSGDANIPDDTISLYLLYQLDADLVLSSRSSRLIPLHGLKSSPDGGSRGSRAELRYNLKGDEISAVADNSTSLHFRQERLEIINQRGIREILLEAGFVNNQVLNDGIEENRLSLQITNLLRNSHIPFQGKNSAVPSRLILSFDTSEMPEYWALFDEDNALGVLVNISGTNTFWHIEKEVQGETPQWILSPAEDMELDAGESFHIDLSNILTAMPSGTANLYIQYENLPGYWDDLYVVPIEKTPFYMEDATDAVGNTIKTHVGIGTHTLDTAVDAAALQIIGGLEADSLSLADGAGGVIPRGGIVMWSGAIADVPEDEGWHLCDGNLDADGNPVPIDGLIIPDLRSRFIVGAGQGDGLSNYNVNETGGVEEHTLTLDQVPDHTHTATSGSDGDHHHDIPGNEAIQDVSSGSIEFPSNILENSAISDDGGDSYLSMAKTQTEGDHSHTITINSTTGGGGSHPNRPPYYALAFIIKL